MTYRYTTFFKWVNFAIDYLLLNFVLYISFILENPQHIWSWATEFYQFNFILLNLLWFYCSSLVGLYDNIMKKYGIEYVKSTVTSLSIFIVVPLTISTLLPGYSLSTSFLMNSLFFYALALMGWRYLFLYIRKNRRKFWIEYKNIVIVGANQVGQNLYDHLSASPALGYKVEGFFDDDFSRIKGHSPNYLGKVDECIDYALSHGISEIYCALQNGNIEQIKTLMMKAEQHMIRFRIVPDLHALYQKNVMLEVYGDMPILSTRQEPLENKANEIVKRSFDVVFSLSIIVLILSWFIPLMAFVIKFDSKGPVFFKQLRSGKNNRPFYCLKFRSMAVNSDSDTKQAFKGDSRITKVGAFMRKTSIDELPQFINVLMGDMSVVGPRPHMLKHTEDYSLLINTFMVRHFLTPGITGWAQVTGYRGETKDTKQMEKRVEADIWYLENWNLLLDLKIIFLTVWNALRGDEKAF